MKPVAEVMRNLPIAALWFTVLCGLASGQSKIEAGGIVNAASYAQPIAPGSIVSIFGANLAAVEATAQSAPLPTELAGTSVSVNGTKAGLLYVSPGQINLEVPDLAIAYGAFTQGTFIVTTAAGASAAVSAPVYISSPALFTINGSGCGQAAALNVAADGAVSVNSRENGAAPGDYVALFGTGLPASLMPGLTVDGKLLASVAYAGAASGLAGVNQINFQIPGDVREGCAIPIAVSSEGLASPLVTLSIHSGRGQCVDPPTKSYGQITLVKTVTTGTANDGTMEAFRANFPAAPGLNIPPPQTVPPPGSYIVNAVMEAQVSRTCNGFPALSAGVIGVGKSGGPTVAVQPTTTAEGVTYQQSLPSGFLGPGQYAISSSGGPVVLQGTTAVGAPIQIQTALPPGMQIPSNQPLVLKWTGGDPGTLVKVSLISIQGSGIYSRYDYAYADAAAGALTLPPVCFGHSVETGGNGVVCTFGIPPSRNAQVVVEVVPAPDRIPTIGAQGITETVQVSWMYRFVFAGLSLQ